MKAQIIKQRQQGEEFYTPERCFITEIANDDSDPEVSIARARVEPGVTTRWHRLNETAERYYILSGSGCVEIGDLPKQRVNAGDLVFIPAQCRQRITNTGLEDLVF